MEKNVLPIKSIFRRWAPVVTRTAGRPRVWGHSDSRAGSWAPSWEVNQGRERTSMWIAMGQERQETGCLLELHVTAGQARPRVRKFTSRWIRICSCQHGVLGIRKALGSKSQVVVMEEGHREGKMRASTEVDGCALDCLSEGEMRVCTGMPVLQMSTKRLRARGRPWKDRGRSLSK